MSLGASKCLASGYKDVNSNDKNRIRSEMSILKTIKSKIRIVFDNDRKLTIDGISVICRIVQTPEVLKYNKQLKLPLLSFLSICLFSEREGGDIGLFITLVFKVT